MACLLVTAAEAIVVTVAQRALKRKTEASPVKTQEPCDNARHKSVFLRRLNWLSGMLWGGSFLLAFEHVWSGEVTPWFPFLTATATPEETSAMLFEMGTSGVAMAALITAVWMGMALVAHSLETRPERAEPLQGGR
jgi:hypothetical protein